ncbi:response regulator [Cerasicoccus frondis]|uniref:response regulator n=1 Tax=Cerasicoccus frondis TaxID=490090 RepID=UPI0028524E81|nr:response regulator [Cerasicoccus frondis]
MSEPNTEEVRFKLLLAEDEDDHVCLVERSLESAPISVQLTRVRDGAEALDCLFKRGDFANAETPDLLLLDLKLPGMSGFELLEEIRETPRFAALPTVVFSTSNARHDVERAYQLGANSYLKKPMEFADFRQMVSVLCVYWGVWNQATPFDSTE